MFWVKLAGVRLRNTGNWRGAAVASVGARRARGAVGGTGCRVRRLRGGVIVRTWMHRIAHLCITGVSTHEGASACCNGHGLRLETTYLATHVLLRNHDVHGRRGY